MNLLRFMFAVSFVVGFFSHALAEDWRMFGRDGTRNGVSPEKNPPLFWEWGRLERGKLVVGKNVKWGVEFGLCTNGDPVVADGLVWVGTSRYRSGDDGDADGSLLACMRASDGKVLYEYFTPRLANKLHDWDMNSLGNSPVVDGDRVWFLTNRAEVVCLDIEPLKRGTGEPRVLWKLDMYRDLHVRGFGTDAVDIKRGSIAAYRDWIYVQTGESAVRPRTDPQPGSAPSLICLEKATGRLVWKDDLPKSAILDMQPSSPLVAEIDGRAQVIVGQGDGWLRSFDPASGKVLWKFDMNRKTAIWDYGLGDSDRNYIFATPVLYDGRIYLGNGRGLEHGSRRGRLCCIDPMKSGDISAELAVDAKGRELPHRPTQAVDAKRGEKAVANPNSGLVWEYTGFVGKVEDLMYGMNANVAVADGLVIAPDTFGFLRCLDAKSGKLHWTYDIEGAVCGSPLVVDGYVYIADEEGRVSIFKLSADLAIAAPNGKPLAQMDVSQSTYCAPVFANGTLYVATRSRLLAIEEAKPPVGKPDSGEN
jgi:outer membrane protein assembly factor BamB